MANCNLPELGRLCNVCGSRFVSHIKHKRTCSNICSKQADRERAREYQRQRRQARPESGEAHLPGLCIVCGGTFQATRPGHIVCSRQCRNKRIAATRVSRATAEFAPRACLTCGRSFAPQSYQQGYCDRRCRRVKQRQDQRKRRVPVRRPDVVKACKECGGQFSPRDDRQYLCSVTCNDKVQSRVGARTRRARLAGVKRERIDPVDVFKRDGYRCGLCGRKTLASKRGTDHPAAPELDHIVAISLGGTHTLDNVQCACASCNRRKGAGIAGQLHLFPSL